MKRYILPLLICVYGLLHWVYLAQPSNPKSIPWQERLAELERELRYDRDRNKPLLFADMSDKPIGAQTEAIMRQVLQQMEKLADQHTSALTTDERDRANLRLTNLKFEAPSQVSRVDLQEIVDYFVQHPILDPRILQIEIEDENTLMISAGEIRGPLAGGGQTYAARRENGKWIVRLHGNWIS